ncbi:MAG: serine/threonine protein phosphatase [Leptospiraceae bacterium]|nr:serine/threonine protein phosphatase [Leptospiraceae bacterium]MCP5497551.1 serine/threonine protein phosphatase [Leptospiraceae bacterium]
MSEKFIAIGDIHGCYDELQQILDRTCKFPEHKLVFLGDYIDRGPNDNEVIETLKNIDGIYIMGNHEYFLIDSIEPILDANKKNFFRDKILKQKNLKLGNYIWLKENLIFKYETDFYIFTHAGLNPNKPLETQEAEDYVLSNSPEPYPQTNKTVVHGHIHKDDIMFIGNNVFVDTGCAMGGCLSALVLPEKIKLQSRKSKNYFQTNVLGYET